VHAFAVDPARVFFVLIILGIAIGGGFTLYTFRAGSLKSHSVFSTFSRESGLVLNNLLLSVAAAVVLIGTLWPLIIEFTTGEKISVGEPFFNMAFTPFMVILAMALPIGAILPWKRAKLGRAMKPLWGMMALSVALGALVWALQTGERMLAPIGLTLATWIILGAVADFASRSRFGQIPFKDSLRRLRNLPRSDWGKVLAHSGLGMVIFGISAVTAWQTEDIRTTQFGDRYELSGYYFTLNKVENLEGPNYDIVRAEILVEDGSKSWLMYPEKRNFRVQRMPTTEAAIDSSLTRDVYIALGDPQAGGGYAVRLYIKPFVNWMWIGALVMAFCGFTSSLYR